MIFSSYFSVSNTSWYNENNTKIIIEHLRLLFIGKNYHVFFFVVFFPQKSSENLVALQWETETQVVAA